MTSDVKAKLDWLYGLERIGIRLGLGVMTKLLAQLGNPHQQWPSIHITGTNGKGSTAAFLERVLREEGYRTGLYTSPHLYKFNERVRVAGREISKERLLELVEAVKQAAVFAHVRPTFFEFTTALAFLQFARAKVEVAVVEAGMGAKLDATNVLMPLVSVITNIGLDHTSYLGRTRAAVARDKAGIVKPRVPLVTAERDPSLVAFFKKICQERKSKLYLVEESLVKGLAISLRGQHQVANAATALQVLRLLPGLGMAVRAQSIRRGLANTRWEGRLDIVSRRPLILVDGAHNGDGVRALKNFLVSGDWPSGGVLLVAVKKGKNARQLLAPLLPLFRRVIVTQGSYEPAPAKMVAQELRRLHSNVVTIPAVPKAVAAARRVLRSGEMMLVTGSLYMIGDALAVLRPRN